MKLFAHIYATYLANVCALLLLGCGIASDAPAKDYARELPLLPGEFVDIGTHRLHYHCLGNGSPTIVVDNGIAGTATEWYPVQVSLAGQFRTCVYDRAGYVWSEPGPSPRNTQQIATELRTLLQAAGEKAPFVIVGHSFGGFTAMYLAKRFPEEIAGIVLVDSSSPSEMFDTQATGHPLRNPIETSALAGTDKVPSNRVEMAKFLNSRRKALFAQMDEIGNFQRSADQVVAAGEMRETPLLVLARGPVDGDADPHREQRWRDAQTALAGLSRYGKMRIADGSDHMIHQRQPQWVADAIIEFISQTVRDPKIR